MVRLMKTGVILLLGCFAMPALAQTAKEQHSVGKAAAEQGPAGQSALASTATLNPLDSFTEFSAVMVGSRVEPGEGTSEGHIYRSGKLMRMEDPGRRGYFITDLTTGETYGMSEAGCMHDSHPFIRTFPFSLAAKPDTTVTRAATGRETVEGHSCQVEDITFSLPNFASALKMRFWEAQDLHGFPIKIEFLLPGGRNSIVHYRSVVLGAQDPTLFIHPKSCEQLSQQESTPNSSPAHKKPAAE